LTTLNIKQKEKLHIVDYKGENTWKIRRKGNVGDCDAHSTDETFCAK
jgi:hypothetical protein